MDEKGFNPSGFLEEMFVPVNNVEKPPELEKSILQQFNDGDLDKKDSAIDFMQNSNEQTEVVKPTIGKRTVTENKIKSARGFATALRYSFGTIGKIVRGGKIKDYAPDEEEEEEFIQALAPYMKEEQSFNIFILISAACAAYGGSVQKIFSGTNQEEKEEESQTEEEENEEDIIENFEFN